MISGGIIGVLSVYVYVAVLFFISEKVLNKRPLVSRKFLHIMVGNVFFILPLFEHAWVMAFVAAAPFIVLTFLVSPYSPLKTVSGASAAGHGMGLVYYSISWTVLAYAFFGRPEIIAIGIVAMSYGDGFASLIGTKFGKRKYNIFGDWKSVEGSLSMFVVILIASAMALAYYHVAINMYALLAVAFIATLIEGITPKGMDNLTVSFSAAIIYYVLV